jgi:hypothetical protein
MKRFHSLCFDNRAFAAWVGGVTPTPHVWGPREGMREMTALLIAPRHHPLSATC